MNRITHAGLTDQGRVRERNEDRWLADPEFGLFVVADGMGGECAGELAAEIVIKTLPLLLRQSLSNNTDWSDPRVVEQVGGVLADLSHRVRQESKDQPGLDGMGATVVLTLIRDQQAIVAHMGDSRAYLFQGGRLVQLTQDHSIVQLLLDCGEITLPETVHHPSRGQLTRFIGMSGEPLPAVLRLEVQPGDRLLLCSDGLNGMLADAEISSVLAGNIAPTTACKRLVEAANAAGGRDNVTVVIVAVAESRHDPRSASSSPTSLSTSASEQT